MMQITPARWPEARILVVDDEHTNTRLLARLLARAGYTKVRTLTDAPAALEEFRGFEPDLVLLDLRMPQLDGFTLLRLMKQAGKLDPVVPVLVVSADTTVESRRRARTLGANDYITKPYDLWEMLLRVDALLEVRAHTQGRFREIERLRATLTSTIAEQSETELQVLAGLSAACAFRDSVSEGHTERVGDLAAALAIELRLPEDTVRMVRQCAPLHDVGKIAIPDEILLKPGPLTAEEMSIAERHTTLGAMILSGTRSPLLRLAAEIALTHHERWDGSGYPRGLQGTEIPEAGRIVAVADVFDALTHARPYKEAWPARDALAEIARGSGTHFDPDVVDALLNLMLHRESADVAAWAA